MPMFSERYWDNLSAMGEDAVTFSPKESFPVELNSPKGRSCGFCLARIDERQELSPQLSVFPAVLPRPQNFALAFNRCCPLEKLTRTQFVLGSMRVQVAEVFVPS